MRRPSSDEDEVTDEAAHLRGRPSSVVGSGRVAPADKHSTVKCKLFRESELTSREASRCASASHGTRSALSTGTADRSPAVPVEGFVQKARTADKCCAHSFRTQVSAPQHRCTDVGERARRRSLCLRCTWLIPEASLQVAGGAYTHGICTHHMALTVVIASCSCRPWMGNGADTQSISMTVLVMDSCNWSWCAMVCNELQRFVACAARERLLD